MDSVRASQPALDGLVPYDPKYIPADVMISANENTHIMPADIAADIAQAVAGVALNRYPDPLANELRDAIAAGFGLERGNVLLGNGGDELLFNLALAWGGPGRTFLNMPPTFSVYAANARLTGTKTVDVPRRADYSLDEEAVIARASEGDIDFIVLTSPNNPTGDLADLAFVERLLESTDALVLLDEAYGEFAGAEHSALPLLKRHKNLLILHTFSKAYGLAGVRLGYFLGHEEVIAEFLKVRQPYSVDAVSQAIGLAVWNKRERFAADIAQIGSERDRMIAALDALGGVKAYPSAANFFLLRVPAAGDAWRRLLDAGVLVRDFSRTPGLEDCLRISVGTPEENDRFLEALRAILKERES